MSRYGNLGAFDYRVTNVPQYDLEADINKGIERGLKTGQMIRKNFKSEADKTIERQKQIANQLALDEIDLATKESLVLPSDSDSGSINKARVDFSNKLVDRLNQAKIARDDGRLTAADYSKVVMTLEAQIPAYKGAEQVMARGIELYAEGVSNNRLSKANSPTSEEFWSAMLRGKADVSYEYDENGKMEMVGTWINSNGSKQPIKAALEKFENLPFILEKPVDSEGKVITAASTRAVDVENILATKQGSDMAKLTSRTGPGGAAIYETNGVQPIMTKDLEGNDVVKPWFQQFSDDSFNGYFNSLGNGDLKMGIMQYILDGEPTARDLDEDGVDDGFGYSAVKDLVEGKTVNELTLIKDKLKAQYTDMLVTDVQEANKAKVDQLNTSAMGDAAAYAKDEAAILRTQQLKNQMAKQNEEGGKVVKNDKPTKLTTALNDLEEAGFKKNSAGVYMGALPETNEKLKSLLETLGFNTGNNLGENKGWVASPEGKSGKFEIKTGMSTQEFVRKFLKSRGIDSAIAKEEAYTSNKVTPYDNLFEDEQRFKNMANMDIPSISSVNNKDYKGIKIQ